MHGSYPADPRRVPGGDIGLLVSKFGQHTEMIGRVGSVHRLANEPARRHMAHAAPFRPADEDVVDATVRLEVKPRPAIVVRPREAGPAVPSHLPGVREAEARHGG